MLRNAFKTWICSEFNLAFYEVIHVRGKIEFFEPIFFNKICLYKDDVFIAISDTIPEKHWILAKTEKFFGSAKVRGFMLYTTLCALLKQPFHPLNLIPLHPH